MSKLAGKIIVVTGSGAGFGRGIVLKLVSEGAKVLGIDLSDGNNEETKTLCPKDTFVPLNADITLAKTWETTLLLGEQHFGSEPSIIVNCAGVVHLGAEPHEVTEDMFDLVFKVNVKPIYLAVKVIIPRWIETGTHGSFINIGSISQARPRPTTTWYAASKGAVTAATKGLAAAYAKHNIRFNVIRPSIGETAMLARVQGGEDTPEGRAKRLSTVPLGRFCQPEDVANMVSYLASDDASYITGSAFNVDGGRCVS